MMNYLNRLFARQRVAGTQFDQSTQPIVRLTGQTTPLSAAEAWRQFAQNPSLAGLQRVWNAGKTELQGRPSTYTGGGAAQALRAKYDVEGTQNITRLEAERQRTLVRGVDSVEVNPQTGWSTVRYILADGSVSKSYAASGLTVEDMAENRKDHLEMMMLRNEWPQIVWEDSRLALGMSDDEMIERGYEFNPEKGYWEYVGPPTGEPQSYGAAMPYGGYGYGYGGGGGGGRGGRGYSYPNYSYPSGGGGTYKPFVPFQSAVTPEVQGRLPQQVQSRAGRFGMVTWRI
jgi:hypothetical protein